MLRKSQRADRGELTGPSVVQTKRARLFGGAPNALIGIPYYLAVAAVAWSSRTPALLYATEAVAIFAAAISASLAYSLLFVTRMSCLYCWSAHVANWALALCLAGLIEQTAAVR